MSKNRREFLKTAVLTSSAWVISTQSAKAQWLTDNILEDIAKPVITDVIDTDKIEIRLPKIAEKGIAVPITVSSNLENVKTISIFVEKNPQPLVATFRLSAELEAFVSARLKMAETSDIIVIVETQEALYRAREQVKVVLGDGCGS
jgi:sulfur-oxidizing protein SoxY